MLKIYFSTGTAWTQTALVEGTLQDDLLELIEEYVMEHEEDFIKYDYSELSKDYTDEEINGQFLPINGGEYYIDMIEHVEEVEVRKYFKGKKVKELVEDEKEYLEKSISGDYRIDDDGKIKEGRMEVTIDFENGLSVGGWQVWEDGYVYYELDDDAEIYDPADM